MPPVEVTFPDGTVVRTDEDDGAELTRDDCGPRGLSHGTEKALRLISRARRERLRHADRPVIGRPFRGPGAAMHVLATSTLRRLADEHPDGSWDPRRMRPNILIDDSDRPGNEDDWLGCDVHIGEQAVVHVVGPTPRCVMTTLAQPGLPKDAAVLKAVARVGLKGISVARPIRLCRFVCRRCHARCGAPRRPIRLRAR